jgi:hypothetical protein
MAALRQAEVTPESANARSHVIARATTASRNTTGRKSRVVVNAPMPRVSAIGFSVRVATLTQLYAVAVPRNIASATTVLAARDVATASNVQIGLRKI